MLNANIKAKGFIDKSNVPWFIDNSDLDEKAATLATKSEIKADPD